MERVVSFRAALTGRWRRASMIGALSLLPFCGPARAAGDSWRERLDHAEHLAEKDKNEEAAREAQGALADAEKSLGPEAPEIGHILARLSRFYEDAGDATQFPKVEKRLSTIESKNFEVWLALGGLLRFQEKFLEAEGALKKSLSFEPADPEAERELAMVYQELGRDEDAAGLFEKAIKQNPRNYDLYLRLARSDIRLGRYTQSKEVFARARKIQKQDVPDYIEQGYFHLDVGEFAQAKKLFESAIAVDTANPLGYHHMGAYFDRNGQYPEAEKYLRQALKMEEANPNTKTQDLLHTISWLGNVLLDQGRSAEAEPIYRKCLEKAAPSSLYVTCLLSLGGIYASQGKSTQAEETYKRAADMCEKRPSCSECGLSLIGLGDFYLKQGRRREASAMAERAGKLCAGFRSDPYLLMKFAGLYVSLGDVPQGEEIYGRILTARPLMPLDVVTPSAQRHMADLDMTQGRFHEAEAFYRQAIPTFKNHHDWQEEAEALDGLAAACEKQRKPQEAAEAREKAKVLRARP